MPGLHQRDGLQPNRRDVARSWAKNRADTGGADILIQVDEELQSQGTTLALARVHPPVLALWDVLEWSRRSAKAMFSTAFATLFMHSSTTVPRRNGSLREE
jgi:hypothetical protein